MTHPDSHRSRWLAPPSPHCRYRHWLLEAGSLTRAIQSRCDEFRVRRIAQGLALPERDEAALLRLRERERCVVREVLLCCGNLPLVYAHSIMRRQALAGPWRSVSGLGERPLGAALFADPRIVRHPLRFRRLDRRHTLYQHACAALPQPPRELWARRALYTLQREPLLVTEIFLPGILELVR
ncbi:MAG: chorismate lyase [Pseudomonadota bacterium]